MLRFRDRAHVKKKHGEKTMMQTRERTPPCTRLVIMYQSQQINTQDVTTNMTTTNAHKHAQTCKQRNGSNSHLNKQRPAPASLDVNRDQSII